MSETYQDLPNSNFPEKVDDLSRMSDLTYEDLALAEQYDKFYKARNLTEANDMLENNPNLKTKIFNAEKFNKLRDSTIAVQRWVRDTIYSFFQQKQAEVNAKVEEANVSKANAKSSEEKAKVSETNSKNSETKSKTSETNAKSSENKSAISEANAKTSETNSKTYETNASKSASEASNSAQQAADSAAEAHRVVGADYALESEFVSHRDDGVKHITAEERTAWNNKAPKSHSHDDRYYTESEIDSKLAGIIIKSYVAQTTAPSNTKILWVDTSHGKGVLKYYNGSSWTPITAVWG